MSDSEHRSDRSPRDEGTDEPVAEQPTDQTLHALLSRAHRPPRMRPLARARILARLKASRRPVGGGRAEVGMVRRVARKFRSATGLGVALAAAAAVALVISFGLQSASPTTHRNDGYGPRRVVLTDGTSLVLDRDSEVEVLATRRVRLVRGRALLDVVRAEDPLVVETKHGRAVVLGTRFVLEDTGDQTRAAVARGRVKIESEEGSALLRPGDEGILRPGEAPAVQSAQRLTYLTDWARAAMVAEQDADSSPVRNGTLVAREPRWDREWPLEMRDLTIDVRVEGGVARTTIDQTFFNHVDRQLEGRYSFPLPSDAAISRLAMYVDGRLVEGGIVERQRGRDIYESIVYRRRDPALLEWMAGNLFRVRIFPLPARQEKRIILSYTQALPRLYDTDQLVVPIPAIDVPVRRVSFRAVVAGGAGSPIVSRSHPIQVTTEGDDQVATFEAQHHRIGDDFLLTLRKDRGGKPAVASYEAGADSYLMARIQPEIPAAPRTYRSRRWVVLYDTSASRDGAARTAQAYLLARLLGELDEEDQLTVLAFDTTQRALPGGMQRIGDLDVERVRAFLEAEGRDRVGGTDLAGALKAALDGDTGGADDPPYLLYLGDGIAPGPDQSLPALRSLVEGRAVFVGVAVGDQVDETRLRGLADTTGGFFMAVNQGDDLAWRAFDLVAALNTPRLVEVKATLIDDGGRPIAGAQAHAPSQVAGGEDVVVVAKLPAGQPVAQVKLTAKLDGEPWSRSLAVISPTKGARYLPRLWARRQIGALQLDDGAAHEKEITELGMDHFLVTPHTSLLVLENDAMYRQFRVNRGSPDSWARYPAPQAIPVKVEPRGGAATDRLPVGSILLRTPRRILADPRSPVTGTTGTGTGAGFGGGGRRANRWGGDLLDRRAGEIVTALEELESAGPETDFLMSGPRTAFDRKVVNTRSSWEADPAWVGVPMAAASAAPMPMATMAPQAGPPLARGSQAAFGAGKAKPRRTRQARAAARLLGADLPLGAPRSSLAAVEQTVTRLSHEVFRQPRAQQGRYYGGTLGSGLRPAALQWPRDPGLDDLSEWVPALLTDPVDGERELLLAEQAVGRRGSVAEPARDLLAQARAAHKPGHYRTSQGGTLTVDADGRFVIEQRSSTGLNERLVYDGSDLHSFYPELGLAVQRTVAPAELAVLAAHAPFALPGPARLEAGYHVSRPADRTLRFTPLGGGPEAATELDLDESLRVVAWRRGDAALRFERQRQRLSIVTARGTRVALDVLPKATASMDTTLPGEWIRIRLPARDPAYWEQRIGDTAPGSAEWLDGQRQRLAALAALGKRAELWQVLQTIHQQQGAITRGELVLASGGLRHADARALEKMIEGWPDDDPVARHARAVQRLASKGTLASFEQTAEKLPDGLVGMLASYRILLETISQGDSKASLGRYGAFAARGGYAPLRYVAAHRLSSQWAWREPEAALAMWDDVARLPPFELVAGFQAAAVLEQAGRHDAAASRLERLYEQADQDRTYPSVNWTVRNTFASSSGGLARWRHFLAQRGTRLLETKDPRALLALLEAAQVDGAGQETAAVLETLAAIEVDDPGVAMALATQLRRLDQSRRAWTLLERHFEGPEASAVLMHATDLAAAEGRYQEAAKLLALALDAMTRGVPLGRMRQIYQHQFDLYLRASDGMGATEALQAALAVAARWRRDDPDNSTIDRKCAAALYDRGQAARGWRQLSSIIERHPAEGAAYGEVADFLEQHGQLRRAQTIWQQASEVEPTNPSWLLRLAQTRITLGDRAGGKELLQRIDQGDWQERFSDTVATARRLLEPLDSAASR
ncbi:MAG: FecR domain-containing protein [Deltaproteobacteria bacterium]|nr:FecR domain-containing protein [Deltaproteobacteria bacterium]